MWNCDQHIDYDREPMELIYYETMSDRMLDSVYHEDEEYTDEELDKMEKEHLNKECVREDALFQFMTELTKTHAKNLKVQGEIS